MSLAPGTELVLTVRGCELDFLDVQKVSSLLHPTAWTKFIRPRRIQPYPYFKFELPEDVLMMVPRTH